MLRILVLRIFIISNSLDSVPHSCPGSIPCLEAHILFMCIRYADHCGSEEQTSKFIEGVASSIHHLTKVSISLSMMLHSS